MHHPIGASRLRESINFLRALVQLQPDSNPQCFFTVHQTGESSGGGDYSDEVVGGSDSMENGGGGLSSGEKIYSGIRLAYYKECLCTVKMLVGMTADVTGDGPAGIGGGSGGAGGGSASLVLTRQDHVELINVRHPVA